MLQSMRIIRIALHRLWQACASDVASLTMPRTAPATMTIHHV